MSTAQFKPVKVGTGSKIHAGRVYTQQKGRYISESYDHICGSGDCTHAHKLHKASARLCYGVTLADVNCEKCRKLLERYQAV